MFLVWRQTFHEKRGELAGICLMHWLLFGQFTTSEFYPEPDVLFVALEQVSEFA